MPRRSPLYAWLQRLAAEELDGFTYRRGKLERERLDPIAHREVFQFEPARSRTDEGRVWFLNVGLVLLGREPPPPSTPIAGCHFSTRFAPSVIDDERSTAGGWMVVDGVEARSVDDGVPRIATYEEAVGVLPPALERASQILQASLRAGLM